MTVGQPLALLIDDAPSAVLSGPYLEARARTALGCALRNPDAAAANLTRAPSIMRKPHRLPEQAALLKTLGGLAVRTGQPSQARRHYQQAPDLLPVTHPAAAKFAVGSPLSST